MPRRQKQNFDFDIHVDPSCLSEPNGEEIMSRRESLSSVKDSVEDVNEVLENQIREQLEGVPVTKESTKESSPEDEAREEVLNISRRGWRDLDEDDEATPTADASLLSVDQDASVLSGQEEEASTLSGNPDESFQSTEYEQHPEDQSMISIDESEVIMESIEGDSMYEQDASRLSTTSEPKNQDVHTPEPRSRRGSEGSTVSDWSQRKNRVASGRTEALIQAAARDIIAQIENTQMRESIQSIATTTAEELDDGLHQDSALSMDGIDEVGDGCEEAASESTPTAEDVPLEDLPADESSNIEAIDESTVEVAEDAVHEIVTSSVGDVELHNDAGAGQERSEDQGDEQEDTSVDHDAEEIGRGEDGVNDEPGDADAVAPTSAVVESVPEPEEELVSDFQEAVGQLVEDEEGVHDDAQEAVATDDNPVEAQVDVDTATDADDSPVDLQMEADTAINDDIQETTNEDEDEDADDFVTEAEENNVEDTRLSDAHSHISKRDFAPSQEEEEQDLAQSPVPADGFASGSSHHEDDVFSDHSPRSSLGCPSDVEYRKMDDNVTRRSRTRSQPKSPRLSMVSGVSGVTGVSGYSRYEDDEDHDFMPTIRGTPRPVFRSPSSVKAMQMTSPAPSVFGSPGSRRRAGTPTQRLGSPGTSAQYSPKKTPPRFKRNTPPLVLLHVTLLPLRWGWGDVLNNARHDELSREGKGLREAWRQLQDRMGDTTCERGILLPHPQNDYEVLEERLLEALELPLRRRARILECGHYLGPANEMTLLEDDDTSEEEYDEDMNPIPHNDERRKVHWCRTCRCDIRYDSLGAGKVFRVKVYASNGLMKAGAWDTCWKEMERVDVELEPLVEPALQDELARLEAKQEEAGMQMETYVPQDEGEEEEDEASYLPEEPAPVEEEVAEVLPLEAPVEETSAAPTVDLDAERRLRDEERLREIYGHTPTPAAEPEPITPEPAYADQTHAPNPASMPPSPEEYEQQREQARQDAFKSASLPELLLQSFRVLMADRKNVVILVMGLLVAMLALKKPDGQHPMGSGLEFVKSEDAYVNTAPAMQIHETSEAKVDTEEPAVVQSSVEAEHNAEEAFPSIEVVRIVETVKKTVQETVTATVTQEAAPVDESSVAQMEEDVVADVEALESAVDDVDHASESMVVDEDAIEPSALSSVEESIGNEGDTETSSPLMQQVDEPAQVSANPEAADENEAAFEDAREEPQGDEAADVFEDKEL